MSPTARGAAVVCAAIVNVTVALGDEVLSERVRPFVKQYCATCHNAKSRVADIDLEGLSSEPLTAQRDVWEKVVRKVRTGEMPPPKMPRAPKDASDSLVEWLVAELDRAAAVHPDPGRVAVHRLNRAEYNCAVRDLLGVDYRPADSFPADDSGYGFDNVASVLSLPPVLMEKYMNAAARVSRMALGRVKIEPVLERRNVPRNVPQNSRLSDVAPVSSRGGFEFEHSFPADAEYLLRVRLRGVPDRQLVEPLDIQIDRKLIQRVDVQFGTAEEDEDQRRVEIQTPVRAGRHDVMVTFLRDDSKNENPRLDYTPEGKGRRAPLAVDWVEIGGPFHPKLPSSPESRKQILTCQPGPGKTEEACAGEILNRLARRAWRRPINQAERATLLRFYRMGRQDSGEFEGGLELAIKAILVSPSFLFRFERDASGAKPGDVVAVSDLDLASRLSFFLWSSIPDETLLSLAERRQLKTPAVYEAQIRRMLQDPRSRALTENFAGQWLQLRNLAIMKPDPERFGVFDDDLREAMLREAELFVSSIIREDRSILDLLDARYAYLNDRLAAYYGIPGVEGRQFRRVELKDSPRGGLLTMASILTVTSYPTRTSPVIRGKWILENLLGAPPPPPPPDVPPLQEAGLGKTVSMRQQLEAHRANASCAACHSKMDPLGFALENYDAIGRWRSKDGGFDVDSAGKLPSGVAFHDATELKRELKANPNEFVICFTEKLLTYALGRGLEAVDMPVVRAIVRDAAQSDYRFSAIVNGIANSVPFRMRKEAPDATD